MLPLILWGAMVFYKENLMTSTNGEKARWYLNILVTICMVILALIAWAMRDALARNERDHEVIKEDLQALSAIVTTFFQNAPPNHVHLPDGSVARVVPNH